MQSPTKKKKKKKEKRSPNYPDDEILPINTSKNVSLSPVQPNKKPRRPSRLVFVERKLDFGTGDNSASTPSPSPLQPPALNFLSRNRFEPLDSDSNLSSTVASNISLTSSTVNNINNIVSPLNSSSTSQVSANSKYSTPNAVDPTPSLFNNPARPTIPFTSLSLITTTTLTYSQGTIVHSTPNVSPKSFITVIAPASQPFSASTTLTAPPPPPPLSPPYQPPPPPPPNSSNEQPFSRNGVFNQADFDDISIADFPDRDNISAPSNLQANLLHNMDIDFNSEYLAPPQKSPVVPVTLNQPIIHPPSLYPETIVVSRKSKRKRDRAPAPSNMSSSSNGLSPDSAGNQTRPPPKSQPTINTVPSTQPPKQSARSSNQVQTQPARPSLPPPIHIYTANNNVLIRSINQIATVIPEFKFNNTSLICIPQSVPDHPRIIKLLRDNDVEYYTHDPVNLRPVKLVIKYVPTDITDDDILSDLRLKELPLIRLARVMVQGESKRVPSNILLLTVPKNSAAEYYQLTNLCNLKVVVSDYQGPPLNQCHNCQGFAHSSVMCGRTAKCVRCGQSHKGNPCTAPSCCCANCKGDHPANYRGCPAFAAALKRYAPRATRTTVQPSTNVPPFQPGPTAFPPLPSQKQTVESAPSSLPAPPPINPWQRRPANNPPPVSAPSGSGDNILKDILAMIKLLDISKLWSTFKKVMTQLKATPDPIAKVFMIIEALVDIFS